MMNSNEDENIVSGVRRRMGRAAFFIVKVPFIVLAIILVLLLKSAVVMLVWNAVIPDVFKGPVLTYEQAVGLTILAMMWFGLPRFGNLARRYGPSAKSRLTFLSPEEREKLRQNIRRRVWGTPSA
jgi:hypothetical protein